MGEGSLLVLMSPYLELRHLGPGTIGVVAASYGMASLVARIPAGAGYRPSHARRQIVGGCLLMGAAFATLPLARGAWTAGLLIGLDGIGFALATTAALAELIRRRPESTTAGSIMGWYTGAVGTGYAVAGFLAGSLADRIGIPDAIAVLALVPLIAGVMLAWVLRGGPSGVDKATPATPFRQSLRAFGRAPGAVWIAFAVSLYINLVGGAIFTFFPLYALGLGLSLTQIGSLTGLHGAVAAAVRFASPLIFSRVSYRRSLTLMVILSGVSVASLAIGRSFLIFALAWAVIGLTRGVLRVASGALVMDSAGPSRDHHGPASSIYLAGLDLGKILGPIAGGVGVHWVGLRANFLVLGMLFPVVYATITRLARGDAVAEKRQNV